MAWLTQSFVSFVSTARWNLKTVIGRLWKTRTQVRVAVLIDGGAGGTRAI